MTGTDHPPSRLHRLRAVFFDLAGTLIRVRGSIGTQYATLARDFGVEAEVASIDRAFAGAFRSAGRMVFPNPDAAEVARLEKEFWKAVVREVFARTDLLPQFGRGQFDVYFDRLFDYFATAAGWEVYPDVGPALRRLSADGLAVGLITNFDYRVFRLVDALDLGRYIESVTIPALAGAAKPDPAIFQHALARHGLEPADALQIGDSFEDDVQGAEATGMRAVLIHRGGRQPPTDARTISSLDELPQMFDLS